MRATAVALDIATRKTNFSQFTETMSSAISALTPAWRHASRKRSARGRCDGASTPKRMRAIVPVCSMTPGDAMRVPM